MIAEQRKHQQPEGYYDLTDSSLREKQNVNHNQASQRSFVTDSSFYVEDLIFVIYMFIIYT